MRQCPKCHRQYFDETLSYCLEDGEWLVDVSGNVERTTQILSDDRKAALGRWSSRAQTEILDPETGRGTEPSKAGNDTHSRPASSRNSIVAGIVGLGLVTALGF